MKILFAAAECAPYAKVGGLADVVGSLPKALEHLGHEVKIIMPKYRQVDAQKWGLEKYIEKWDISRPLPGLQKTFDAYRAKLPNSNVEVIFIANDWYFNRPEIYMEHGEGYHDNPERFAFFCRAVMAYLQGTHWDVDVIHCHDWQTALIPTYQKLFYMADPYWQKIRTVFTIHNLAYQGQCAQDRLEVLGLPGWTFTPNYLEFWGGVNLMKAGLVFSDKLTTVSQRYAEEIQTPEYGCGLDGVLVDRRHDLTGIINGIDYDHWNPATDEELAANFDKDNLANKKKNKNQLLKDNLLPVKRKEVPVFGIISRLVDQKGFDIFSAVADEIMQMDLQMVVLGTGDPKYHQLFKHLKDKYPKKLAVHLKFDAYTAKMIYAGSDFFLMPSRFEPCGLGQMIALAYGTIPMVRATGGLVDTIRDYDPVTKQGNGLVFYDYNEGELLHTIKRAIDIFHQKDSWLELRQNAIRSDFSWDVSAQRFTELYQSLSTA